jgi:hypothetical protein
MKQIRNSVECPNPMAEEINEIRNAAAKAELRTLREIEMGWVGGGDGQPVWPY